MYIYIYIYIYMFMTLKVMPNHVIVTNKYYMRIIFVNGS